MELSGFFPDVDGDRMYTDDFLAEWVSSFIGNGVYRTELAVAPGTGMQVVVQPGRSWINGRYYRNTQPLYLAVSAANGLLNRYSAAVLQFNRNTRSISAKIIDGVPAPSPAKPALTRSEEIYELKLADIFVPANSFSVSAINITDTRLDSSTCGIVAGLVDQLDTESIYAQFESLYKLLAGELTRLNAGTEAMLKTVYDPDSTGNVSFARHAENAAGFGGQPPAYYATAEALQAAQASANAAMPMAGGQFTGQVMALWSNVQGAGIHNIRCQDSAGYDVPASTIITRRK